jgi:hypothetical protein
LVSAAAAPKKQITCYKNMISKSSAGGLSFRTDLKLGITSVDSDRKIIITNCIIAQKNMFKSHFSTKL